MWAKMCQNEYRTWISDNISNLTVTPSKGDIAWFMDTQEGYIYDGTTWVAVYTNCGNIYTTVEPKVTIEETTIKFTKTNCPNCGAPLHNHKCSVGVQ